MISYTDGKMAKYWNRYLGEGEQVLLQRLNDDLKKPIS